MLGLSLILCHVAWSYTEVCVPCLRQVVFPLCSPLLIRESKRLCVWREGDISGGVLRSLPSFSLKGGSGNVGGRFIGVMCFVRSICLDTGCTVIPDLECINLQWALCSAVGLCEPINTSHRQAQSLHQYQSPHTKPHTQAAHSPIDFCSHYVLL